MAKPSDALVSAFQVSVNGETSALPAGASTSARWFNESRHARRSRPGTSSADGLRYIGVHEAPGGRWLNESFLELSQSAGTRFRKNQPFRLRCNCPYPIKVPESLKTPMDVQSPNRCVIEEVELKNLKRSGYLVRATTIDAGDEGDRELRRNLNNPLLQIWVRGSMHHFGVVDGRDETAVPKIGSLGGDLGEWLIGLAAYESVKNQDIAESSSEPRFYLQWWHAEWWLFCHMFISRLWPMNGERKLSFSMATDEARISRAVSNANGWYWARLGGNTEPSDLTNHPRSWGKWWGLQYYLMWHWNQGSEFWKMVIDWNNDPNSGGADTEGLGVRRYLAMFVVRAFYRIMWWWNIYKWWWITPPRLITLQGSTRYLDGIGADSEEVAWLNVKTKSPCNDDMSVPLVSGAGRQGKKYYVYHKQWVERQRMSIARTLSLIDRSVNADAIRDKMNEIGEALKNKLIETAVRPKWDSGKELPEWDVTYQEHQPNQNPSS